MIKDGEEIQITGAVPQSSLSLILEGTILCCTSISYGIKTIEYIPIELIDLGATKTAKGKRSCAAVFAVILTPIVSILVFMLLFIFDKEEIIYKYPFNISAIFYHLALFILLYNILMRWLVKNIVTLYVKPERKPIDIWMVEDEKHNIKELLNEIVLRQNLVNAPAINSISYIIQDITNKKWHGTVTKIFISLGVILCAISNAYKSYYPFLPLFFLIGIFLLFQLFLWIKQPKAYWKALKYCSTQEWGKAHDWVEVLLRNHPEYWPAQYLDIELKLRLQNFYGAESSFNKFKHKFDVKIRQKLEDDMNLFLLIEKRKKDVVVEILPDS